MEEVKISDTQKQWPFLWSKISLFLAAVAWLSVLLGVPALWLIGKQLNITTDSYRICLAIIALLSVSSAGCSFVSGIASTLGFILQKIKISSKRTAFGGLTWSAAYFFLILIYSLFIFTFIFSGRKKVEYAHEVICKSNMKTIVLGFDKYHENNASCPYKANWCESSTTSRTGGMRKAPKRSLPA